MGGAQVIFQRKYCKSKKFVVLSVRLLGEWLDILTNYVKILLGDLFPRFRRYSDDCIM